MPLQAGKLQSGKSIEVTFAADASNTTSSSVVVGHVPTGGTKPVVFTVPAGAGQSRSVAVKKQILLRIDVDVPPDGKGTLTVVQGTRKWDTPQVDGDTIWTFEIE
jgi:hypothetical protein